MIFAILALAQPDLEFVQLASPSSHSVYVVEAVGYEPDPCIEGHSYRVRLVPREVAYGVELAPHHSADALHVRSASAPLIGALYTALPEWDGQFVGFTEPPMVFAPGITAEFTLIEESVRRCLPQVPIPHSNFAIEILGVTYAFAPEETLEYYDDEPDNFFTGRASYATPPAPPLLRDRPELWPLEYPLSFGLFVIPDRSEEER